MSLEVTSKQTAPGFDTHKPAERLKGRRILITGGASGIGKRTAQLFAEESAHLALLDLNSSALGEVCKETGAAAVSGNVADPAQVAIAVAEAARAMGGIDGVVNCAGIGLRGLLTELPVEKWREVIDVNLFGPYLVVRETLPWLRMAPFGTVVNIGSAQGLHPIRSSSSYAASKGGLINMTRALAGELAPLIRVNSVCPGMVEAPMSKGMAVDPDAYALRRIASPLEVAQAILFLTSNESAYITGVALPVDGGRSFH